MILGLFLVFVKPIFFRGLGGGGTCPLGPPGSAPVDVVVVDRLG